MNLKPNPLAAPLKADLYRSARPAAEPQPVPGYHLVQPGEQLIYWGLDETLWGQQVTVTSLYPLDYRCRLLFGDGSALAQVDEHGLFGGLR